MVEEGVRILREVISRDKANGSSGLSTQIWKNLPQILSYSSFSVRSGSITVLKILLSLICTTLKCYQLLNGPDF